MKAEVIVALDVQTAAAIPPILAQMPSAIRWFKVGLELFVAEGPSCLAHLKQTEKNIFLDLKLHDIPNTVARAVTSAGRHGVKLLTLHAGGGRAMLKAAADAARKLGPDAPKLLAVTTLTSLEQADLTEMGVTRPLAGHTLELGKMAISAGIDGLVCSPHEARSFRDMLGKDVILVTPGIRPAGTSVGDQKRIATPADAVKAGATFLVVGRPITDAPDMQAAALEIVRQMEAI